MEEDMTSGYTSEQVLKNKKEYREAVDAMADRWVPACGGLEEPTLSRAGRRYLYVFNPATNEHAWADVETALLVFEDPYAGV